MWSANILGYSNNQALLTVSVQYVNGDGSISYTESLDMSGQTMDSLTTFIQNRLNVLNANDTLASALDTSISSAVQTNTSFNIASPAATP
jgi:hypothetical protein